jgi:G3E family GTPase
MSRDKEKMRTPLSIITGSLGSGKTTLLKYILDNFSRKIAILMNEFGEINIDSKILKGKNIEIAELLGGCVCCSLIGEFEEAIIEIINTVGPEYILVETTGIAEPDALISEVEESLPMVRLDGIVTIIDADSMIRFPQLGHTTVMQIQDADILALNKSDLISEEELALIENRVREINQKASILKTEYCRIDPELIFGLAMKHQPRSNPHSHKSEYESVSYKTTSTMKREAFEIYINTLPQTICRAKGFVNFPEGTYLFNFVNGKWGLESCDSEETVLVFIGFCLQKDEIINSLKACEE